MWTVLLSVTKELNYSTGSVPQTQLPAPIKIRVCLIIGTFLKKCLFVFLILEGNTVDQSMMDQGLGESGCDCFQMFFLLPVSVVVVELRTTLSFFFF